MTSHMQVAILIQKWQYDMSELPITLVTLLSFEQSNTIMWPEFISVLCQSIQEVFQDASTNKYWLMCCGEENLS